jgi:hypothetical protein
MGLWHPPTSKASENLKRPHSTLWDLSSVVRKLFEDGFDMRLRTADAEASAHLPSSD